MSSPRSQKMSDKPKFLERYNKCNDIVKNLIDKIIKKLSEKSYFANWGYTDAPDLRFFLPAKGQEQQFCKFKLYLRDLNNPIRLFIRVDYLSYMPTLVKTGMAENFFVSKERFRGIKWIETRLKQDSQIEPFINVVIELAEIRQAHGW